MNIDERCPTCGSPHPKLHPAMQYEGEVQPCKDDWHSQYKDDWHNEVGSAEWLERRSYDAAFARD